MLHEALRDGGRVAYCFSPAAPEPASAAPVHPFAPPDADSGGFVSIAATFEIEYLQYLDAEGKLVRADLPAFARDIKQLVELYKMMLFVRVFDGKAIAL